jgi:hypothetical protein
MFWAGGRKVVVLQAPLAASDLNKVKFSLKVRKWGMGQLAFQQVIKAAHPPIIRPTSQDPNYLIYTR